MLPSAFSPHGPSDPQESDLAQYQALSVQAVLGLIVGLLSGLVLVTPSVWFLPVAGVALCGLGLWRIARCAPALGGRRLALAGLWLSLAFGAAAPAEAYVYDWLVRREGLAFALGWFAALGDHDAEQAFRLTRNPGYRRPVEVPADDFYRQDPQQRDLQAYTADPLVRKLLNLGAKAQVRYERTSRQERQSDRDLVHMMFLVSYEEAGRPQQFSVVLALERLRRSGGDGPRWQLGQAGWLVLATEELAAPSDNPPD